MLADVIVVVATAQGKSDKLFVERFFIVCMNTFSFALQQLVQNVTSVHSFAPMLQSVPSL